MKINLKGKSWIKKIALVLAGVAAIMAVGFGVKAIVDYTKNDLKTISPTFEVGNLGSDGKFVDDESTLYTKEAFACNGLQVKLEFDNEINYKVFYYDELDNYISATDMLSESFDKHTQASHARIVIEPTNDEDNKISLMERVKYPNQMTIKVSKNQELRFTSFNGKYLEIVDNIAQMYYTKGVGLECVEGKFNWFTDNRYTFTSTTVLKVSGGETITYSPNFERPTTSYIFEFSELPSNNSFISKSSALKSDSVEKSLVLNKNTHYILIEVFMSNVEDFEDSDVSSLSLSFTCEKTK